MSIYVIASYDIADAKGYEPYVPAVVPLLEKHGAEILVADFGAEALEGQASQVNVVLRFESEEAARKWYNDPGYGPVRQIRINATKNGKVILAKPFVPPPA